MRKIQLQRLPVIAVVERNPYGIFRTREEQAFAHRIFANGVHRAEVWQTVIDELPTLAAIVGAVNICVGVIDSEPAH